MQSYLGGTNKGSCYNYGYKTLSAGDNLKYITSGNNGNGYGDNERCYWQFYAPGAYGMGFRLEEIEVTYCCFLLCLPQIGKLSNLGCKRERMKWLCLGIGTFQFNEIVIMV